MSENTSTSEQIMRRQLMKLFFEYVESDYFKAWHGNIGDRKEWAQSAISTFIEWIVYSERNRKSAGREKSDLMRVVSDN